MAGEIKMAGVDTIQVPGIARTNADSEVIGANRPVEVRPSGPVKAPQDMAAGLFLLALAVFAIALGYGLPRGTLRAMGPGMLPFWVSMLVGGAGVGLVISSLVSEGSMLERWSLRGPFFVLAAILTFAVTVRPLGLIVAGPLVVAISGLAAPDTRWRELLIFAVVMTAFCIGLFSYTLRLPIPVWPTISL